MILSIEDILSAHGMGAGNTTQKHIYVVKSSTQPTSDLQDGLVWYNVSNGKTKIYVDGSFHDFKGELITTEGIADNAITPAKLNRILRINTDDLKIVRTMKDNTGCYRVLSWYTSDGKLAKRSTMSNPNTIGKYRTQTIEYFDTNGTTRLEEQTWALEYDTDGLLIQEVRTG